MLILTYITPGYIHWLHHLYLNLQLLSLQQNLHVCVTVAMDLPVQNVTIVESESMFKHVKQVQKFGSKEYGRIVNERHACIWKFYKSTSLLFLDADITLFRSPIPYLNSNIPLFFWSVSTDRRNFERRLHVLATNKRDTEFC